jgi:hypothetical protein
MFGKAKDAAAAAAVAAPSVLRRVAQETGVDFRVVVLIALKNRFRLFEVLLCSAVVLVAVCTGCMGAARCLRR